MSKGVERNQVFRTTRVRTVLKNDGSWIHKPKNDEEEEVRPTPSADGHLPVRQQKSYVLRTARKFGSLDSSVLPHPHTVEAPIATWVSVGHTNGDTDPLQKNAEPKGSDVETREHIETEPQASTVKEIHNGRSQLEKPVAERMEERAEDVEHSEEAADIPVVSPEEECAQTISAAREETEAPSPVKPADQPLTNPDAVNTVEHVEPSADLSALDNNTEPEVSALVDAHSPGVDGSCEKELLEKVEAEGEVSEEPVPDVVESVTKAPSHPADRIRSDVCDASPAEPSTDEKPETSLDLVQECTAAVDSVTEQPDDAPHDTMKNVPDVVPETSGSAGEVSVACAPQSEQKTTTQEEAEVVVELSGPEDEPRDLKTTSEESVEGELQSSPSEEDTVKTPEQENPEVLLAPIENPLSMTPTEDVVDCELKSSNEEPTKASEHEAQSELQDHLILNAITVAEHETEVISQEEQVLKTTNGEGGVCEEQSAGNIPEEQKAEPALKIPEDRVTELNRENSSEPAAVSDAGTVQKEEVNRLIKLTDALDEELPPIKTVPKPVGDLDPPQTEESKQNKEHTTKTNFKDLCSFCNQKIEGFVRIRLSDPPVTCHPDCLKCGVCARVLGDLLNPMFLHGQVIHCGSCVAGALGI